MSSSTNSSEKKLDITKEEMDRLEKAFKDQEFRRLFNDYVTEISDPKNRELYEKELEMLEQDRGNNIRWVKPTPGCVIKTAFVRPSEPANVDKSIEKVFVNICTSSEVSEATVKTVTRKDNKKGQQWSIPNSVTPGREELDKSNKKCFIYDVVFHPETYKKAVNDARVLDMLVATSFETIEKRFEGVKLKREYKKLNRKYMGQMVNTVIRTKREDPASKESSIDFIEQIKSNPPSTQPKPVPPSTSKQPSPTVPEKPSTKPLIEEISPTVSMQRQPKQPTFKIVHQGHVDYQNFVNGRQNPLPPRPESLVVTVNLPGVLSANDVDLDVVDDRFELTVPRKYELTITLPFPVRGDDGNAKFLKSSSEIRVTLPVVPAAVVALPESDIPIEQEVVEEVQAKDADADFKEEVLNALSLEEKIEVDVAAMPALPNTNHHQRMASETPELDPVRSDSEEEAATALIEADSLPRSEEFVQVEADEQQQDSPSKNPEVLWAVDSNFLSEAETFFKEQTASVDEIPIRGTDLKLTPQKETISAAKSAEPLVKPEIKFANDLLFELDD